MTTPTPAPILRSDMTPTQRLKADISFFFALGVLFSLLFAVLAGFFMTMQNQAAGDSIYDIHNAELIYSGDSDWYGGPSSSRAHYVDYQQLAETSLSFPSSYSCAVATDGGRSYVAYVVNARGEIITATSEDWNPVALEGTPIGECAWIEDVAAL